MSVEFLKVICQVVVLERDDNGNVTGERLSDAVPIYNLEGLADFVENVKMNLAQQQANLEANSQPSSIRSPV